MSCGPLSYLLPALCSVVLCFSSLTVSFCSVSCCDVVPPSTVRCLVCRVVLFVPYRILLPALCSVSWSLVVSVYCALFSVPVALSTDGLRSATPEPRPAGIAVAQEKLASRCLACLLCMCVRA
jgi:hypothetical protein